MTEQEQYYRNRRNLNDIEERKNSNSRRNKIENNHNIEKTNQVLCYCFEQIKEMKILRNESEIIQ